MKKHIFTLCVVALSFYAPYAQAQTYTLIKGPYTWHEAKADAKTKGGHLATITSHDESEIIFNLFAGNRPQSWIGLSNVNGNWVWVTGEKFQYAQWASGQPNDWGEDAVCLWQWPHWGDESSGRRFSYILETEDAPPPDKDKKLLHTVIKPVPPGFSLMSIPFSYKGNRISTIFGNVNDITVYDYNYMGGWVVNSYDKEFHEWDVPSHVLEVGSAVWILNESGAVQYIKMKGNIPTTWRTEEATHTSP
jgi:hypothetical protein